MITNVPNSSKILNLGLYKERGDIVLPINAVETGRYKVSLVQVDTLNNTNGTSTTHLVNAIQGEPITLKNNFGRENETYILRIKRPNLLLLRHRDEASGEIYTWFRLRLAANDDPDFGTGNWIHKERVGGTGFTLRLSHAFLQGTEYLYRNGLLQDAETDYDYDDDNKAIQLIQPLEEGESIVATYQRLT